ncbi:MAG: CoA-binding protein [Treponema sp.]|jgi:redox-sensing transcriptional repressor|nr:CoA-binding protein [Treponema sp.]
MAGIPGPAKGRLLSIMRLLEKNGGRPLTSAEAEAMTGWTRETIRKDISCMEADSAGTSAGYVPELLIPAIRKALGLDRRRFFCIVGLGRLGSAYLNYSGDGRPRSAGDKADLPEAPVWEEFELAAGFDSNVNRVEILKSRVPLYPAYKIPEVIGRLSIEIALLCVPAEAAQASAEKLASAGIRGILNFAPAALKLPAEVTVRNVSAVDELRALAVEM